MFIALAPFVSAEFQLQADNLDLSSETVLIELDNNGIMTNFYTIVDDNSAILLDETHGLLRVIYVGDVTYAGEINIDDNSNNNNIIILKPSAKITGYVVDERDNLLKNTKLRITCSDTTAKLPSQTDEFGFFTIERVWFGTCNIAAIHKDKVISEEIVVDESKQYNVKLVVPYNFQSNVGTASVWLIPIVLIILISFIVLKAHMNKKENVENKRLKENNEKHNIIKNDDKDLNNEESKKFKESTNSKNYSTRQEDIIATLMEKEKIIVDQLIVKGALTQSQIRHYTGFPKSTLHRILTKLEQKNIVIWQEEAGVKKIALTDFFNEK